MQFIPRLEEAPGWLLQDDPAVHDASNLQGFLDVDAGHFLRYEVTDLTAARYQRVGADGFATVEIFRFPDFVKAFGAWSTRRQPGSETFDVENGGFLGPHSIHIWRGPFYVRIVGGGPEIEDPMKKLAAAVIEQMPSAPGLPAVFGFLPADTMIPHTQEYTVEPGLGQPALRNAFTAKFKSGESTIDGLVVPTPDRRTAQQVLAGYRAFFVVNGRLLDPVPNLGEDDFTAEDRTFGRTVAFRLDRFVVVFRGYGARQNLIDLAIQTDQKILGSIRTQLQQR